MTLNDLIAELQREQVIHGDKEISYQVGTTSVDILIGEDADAGSAVTIEKPNW